MASLLLRSIPFACIRRCLTLRLINSQHRTIFGTATRLIDTTTTSSATEGSTACGAAKVRLFQSRIENPEYRKWKEREEEILNDIEPILYLTKEILHSDKYIDGQCLSDDDEKTIVDELLAYHPHAEDKIGCGINSIMVDRHPQFKRSRCLFVVRTDGVWIDFSYQKCLKAYIREKYPAYAERFIQEHFKR